MEPLRVLIVEDEPLLSMDIAEIVEQTVPAVVIIRGSVGETKKIIDEPFHLALLDVDVTNGKTYEIARLLRGKQVPYAFVSGSTKSHLPEELQNERFIPKPFAYTQIRDVVLTADQSRRSHEAE